jgi:hypothetical protein
MDQATLLAPAMPAEAAMLPLLLATATLTAGGFLALGCWVRKLAGRLASQEQEIEQLEKRIRPALPEPPGQPRPATGEGSKNRYKVLYLNSLGYSAPEIAKETRLRAAEVNFILKVDAQAATAKGL